MPTITTVDATWTNGMAMDEAELRRADTTMFLGAGSANGVRGGVVRHGDTSLAVSVNGSDQVTVQPGAAVIPAATGLGVYRASLPAATSATGLASRNATNPRIDLVVMQIVSGAAVVKTVDGTPGSSPSAPALPASSVELGRVTVPALGGGAATVDSTWRAYATALGGTLCVETAARLPGSGNIKGQRAVALDTNAEHVWNGTTWRATVADAAVTFGANVSTHGDGSRVYRTGNTGILNIGFIANAALGANVGLMTVPTDYFPRAGGGVGNFRATLLNFNTGGTMFVVLNGAGQLLNEIAITNGHAFRGTLTYPLAA